jgi:hypothetical protein
MNNGYSGLDYDTRGGCIFAAIAGVLALVVDCARFFGDPAPGTEDLWWRQVPFLLPTFIVTAATFLLVRTVARRLKGDGSQTPSSDE